jgi:hypothetical protein
MKHNLDELIENIIWTNEKCSDFMENEYDKDDMLELVKQAVEATYMFDCNDCGISTFNEYYLVLENIWDNYGCGDGMLCIGCLEKRIGRKLRTTDFVQCHMNTIGYGGGKSHRLVDRLTSNDQIK